VVGDQGQALEAGDAMYFDSRYRTPIVERVRASSCSAIVITAHSSGRHRRIDYLREDSWPEAGIRAGRGEQLRAARCPRDLPSSQQPSDRSRRAEAGRVGVRDDFRNWVIRSR